MQPSDELAETEITKTVTAIGETARRARGERPEIPHPFETDRNLSAHLTAATVAADGGGAGWKARIGRQILRRLLPAQLAYNAAIVDVIHQLDHRDRQQREEIADLHQQIAALRDR